MKTVHALLLCLLLALGPAAHAAEVIVLVSNENGNSITQFDITTGVKSAYFSGFAHPDGLAYGLDGFLYATSFGTVNGDGSLIRITGPTTYTTIASGFNGSGALVHDAAGNFYVPNFGAPSGGGTTLSKVQPIGGGSYSTSLLVPSGLHTPDGVAFDSHGVLYEADFGSNAINKIDTTNGTITPFIAGGLGLNQPSALVFDAQDNLYVANYGNGTVSKITPAGGITNSFATGLTNPLGLLLDEAHGTFYATNWTAGTMSSFAATGGTAGLLSSGFQSPTHMVFLVVPEPSASLLGMVSVVVMGARRPRRRRQLPLRLPPAPPGSGSSRVGQRKSEISVRPTATSESPPAPPDPCETHATA
jgi:DNA-binding beta-propeller fold protein YncE